MPRTPRALGLSLPLFIAPLAVACGDADEPPPLLAPAATSAGSGAAGPTGGSGGNGGAGEGGGGQGGAGEGGAGMGGGGGAGGSPQCGDGVISAGQSCFATPSGVDAGTSGQEASTIATGDWNGDGDRDVIFWAGGVGGVAVATGDGTGAVTVGTAFPLGIGGGIYDLDVGDIDDDGAMDVVAVVDNNNSQARLLLGDGSGGVASAQTLNPPGWEGEGRAFSVHVADLPESVAGDDLVVGHSALCEFVALSAGASGGTIFEDGDCTRSTGREAVLAQTSTIASSMVATDGFSPSLVLTPLFILSNQGDQSLGLGANRTTTLEGAASRLAEGDLNGDGWQDVVVVVGEDRLNVLLSDGAHGWVPQGAVSYASVMVAQGASEVALGDLDGDGDLDAAVTLPDADQVALLLNDGTGAFTAAAPITLGVGSNPDALALGDLNGDTVDDIVVGTTVSGAELTVLLSDP